ncbi:MAG: hypothetical protein KDC38_14970, partial [Planctomycetes bacterium]|nr:hypothetical protein [Planctomycetota bacterium]
MNLRLVLIVATAALVSACGSVRPTAAEISRIRTVKLRQISEDSVTYSGKLPSEYEIDQGNSFLSVPILAPIGLLIELWNHDETARRKSERLKEIFRVAEVDVVGAVRTEIESATPRIVQTAAEVDPSGEVGDPIDAQLDLRLEYGLSSGFSMGADWSPWLQIEA